MTPDPLLSADREREALRALSDAATPGEWVRQTVGNASVEQLGHKLLHDLLVPLPDGIPPHTDATYLLTEDGSKTVAFIGNGPRQTENGDFIVAAVNYVRAALATPPAAALSSPETTPAGVLPDEMRREIEALPEPLVWQDNVSRAAVLEIVDQRTPAGVLDEAALREALDRLVKAWDSGITTDAAKWRAADLEIDAALVQARAALGRSGSGGR